ncbi:hypothetical protein LCGC14_2754070, partial [marine sediment metagenome]
MTTTREEDNIFDAVASTMFVTVLRHNREVSSTFALSTSVSFSLTISRMLSLGVRG